MSNLNLQKLRKWVWPWPWTFKRRCAFNYSMMLSTRLTCSLAEAYLKCSARKSIVFKQPSINVIVLHDLNEMIYKSRFKLFPTTFGWNQIFGRDFCLFYRQFRFIIILRTYGL